MTLILIRILILNSNLNVMWLEQGVGTEGDLKWAERIKFVLRYAR